MDLKSNYIRGLALAAGGARGAYQAGALLSLSELGLKFDVISGTSVGVLNGAYYAQGNGSVNEMQDLCLLWRKIGKIEMVELNESVISFFVKLKFIKSGAHILNPQPLRSILDTHLDYDKICKSAKKLIICTIPSVDPMSDILRGNFLNPTYFHSGDIDEKKFRDAILAATAIPIAFPNISIDGKNFSDAGLSVPLPSKVLYDNGIRNITSIFLSDSIIQNRLDYPDAILFQVRPSTNISTHLMSMLDFSLNNIENLINLGYEDVKANSSNIMGLVTSYTEMLKNRDRLGKLFDDTSL